MLLIDHMERSLSNPKSVILSANAFSLYKSFDNAEHYLV